MKDKWLYIIPFSMIIQITLIGQLSGADIFCAFTVFFYLVFGNAPKAIGLEKKFYFYAALWLLGQVISDIYNHTSFDNYMRGWANIGVFIVNFTAIRYIVDRKLDRAVTIVMLLFVTTAIKLRLGIGGVDVGRTLHSGWKFGYGQLTSALFLFCAGYFMRKPLTRIIGLVLPYLAAGIALAMDARNLFGQTALAALVNSLVVGRKKRLKKSHVIGLMVVIGGAGLIIFSVYAYTASHGLLGRRAFLKFAMQSAGTTSPLGILLSGRNEVFASLQAIADSPIFGHGSWAHDYKYALMRLVNMATSGREVNGGLLDDSLIPTHSHLFGAWVMSGILGAVFWIWILAKVVVRGGLAAIRKPSHMTAFFCYIAISMVWDIFFSPFGLDRRFVSAANIYLLMLLAEQGTPQNEEPVQGNKVMQNAHVESRNM